MSNEELDFYPLQVVDVIRETADASSIVFQIDPQYEDKFKYQAGQFMTFQIPWHASGQDFFIQRSYSLSSSPVTGEPHTITVKRVTDGRGSNWFNEAVKPGMEIMTIPPSGRFTLKPEHTNPILLFAGGSGITPVMSIIKTNLENSAANKSRPMTLVYANRDQASIIFHKTLTDLTELYPALLTCHHHLDAENGYIDAEKVTQLIDGNWEADFYICGPGPFMDLVEYILIAHGVPGSQIFIERFVSPVDADQQETNQTESAANAYSGDVKLTVTVDGTDYEVPYQSGKTLLECVLDNTEIDDVPHSCTQGHCGSCMAILKVGEVTMRENHVLSKRDLENGYVLACQSDPQTAEVWIDFDE